jgi:HNH endonuclease
VAHGPIRRARASIQSAAWVASAPVRLDAAAWLAARSILAPGPPGWQFWVTDVQAPVGERNTRSIPQDVKIAVAARDGGRCRQCGSTTELHFDHVIPWSKGGANTVTNIQLLCGPCNRRKGADDIPVGI